MVLINDQPLMDTRYQFIGIRSRSSYIKMHIKHFIRNDDISVNYFFMNTIRNECNDYQILH